MLKFTTTLFCSLSLAFSIVTTSCKHKKDDTENTTPTTTVIGDINASTDVMGYNILKCLPGIWNGSLTSTTALGGFPQWIVDFRPIMASQVTSENELDSLNDIFMNFFIVKHNNAYKMAFRNGGTFAGMKRISYTVIDSVSETPNNYFYRFSDFKAGRNRLYMEARFKYDSLILHVYTNKYNTLATAQTHFIWRAKLQDTTSAQAAKAHFNFPQKQMVKDFSTTFDNMSEAIYYDESQDPYPTQPYLGTTTVNLSYGNGRTPDPAKKVILTITTQPLFSGYTYNASQLKYISRYVVLSATDNSFTFKNMHPGIYYVYPFYDNNGDGTASSGDWMSSNFNNTFTLNAEGSTTVNSTIDFTIP